MNACAPVDSDIVASIDALFAGISAQQRRLLALIAEFDASGRWSHDGCRDMAQWLSGRIGISNWAARRWVAAAHAIDDLPHVSNALESGTLGLDKVVELTRWATPETEAALVSWARRVSPAAVRRRADRARRDSVVEIADVERARFLRWWHFDEGRRMGLEGEFPAAQGAAIATAIAGAAERLPESPLDDEFRSRRR